jgi:hypothetical protein
MLSGYGHCSEGSKVLSLLPSCSGRSRINALDVLRSYSQNPKEAAASKCVA